VLGRRLPREATVKVILYDVYPYLSDGDVFFKQDSTCPMLCAEHMSENESQAQGVREPRGLVEYPYTNRNRAQGFAIYFPLDEEEQETLLELLQKQFDSPTTQN
jgi:hypothetical protein